MIANGHTSERILIVGGGVSGLSIACRMAQAGLPVTVLEASRPGIGASTRNQGWLHSGAWFAPQHPELARLCYRSLQHTLAFCPECLEPDTERMAFVFSRRDTDRRHWTEAWRLAGIPFEEWPRDDLRDRLPGTAAAQVRRGFRLPDRAVRFDRLVDCLATTAVDAGAELRSGTPVCELVIADEIVRGVKLGGGEQISARVVILAGNAAGASLWPGIGGSHAGRQSEFTRVFLKTHLMAVEPAISRVPFCVVDAGGLNHIPHQQASVFGTSRWQVVKCQCEPSGTDEDEVDALRAGVQRFFPSLNHGGRTVTSWAGTTVQAMHFDQIDPGTAPLPTTIDHAHESPRVGNLLSVFPGRATLWPQLAEQASRTVFEMIDPAVNAVARPPWECASA
ncbi:MAG: NAD(P)/FAD-dependent oxidoreductase [Planctomycetaceae bacterium]